MTKIPIQEAAFITDSLADDVGRVFVWRGHLLRAIRYEYVGKIEALLNSGLLPELVAADLSPNVQKTNYQLDGYGLILEHERIPVVTYPYEWSFSMLKDAAIVMLRVNQIARKYGYQTKDAHGYNVLFRGSQPVFIDLGSFIKLKPGDKGWLGYEEFLRFFYYPLKLWCEGNEFLARRVFSGAMKPLMPHDSYLAYRLPITRYFNAFMRQRLARLPLLFNRVANLPKEDMKRIWPGRKGVLLSWLRPCLFLNWQASDLAGLLQKMQRLRAQEGNSKWGEYQTRSGLFDAIGQLQPSSRFKRISELITQFEIESVVELAGNEGAFARYLLTTTGLRLVTCTDYDTEAIDRLYQNLGTNQCAVTPAVLDFMSPLLLAETKPPAQRLQAEAVIALAVTHHLILTQRLPLDKILSAICHYAHSYVFVEFMPLGLFSGHSETDVPAWYRLDWFREGCSKCFRIVVEEQLEENRILIVGKKDKI